MRAFQVTKLDQLMAQKLRIAIGNQEMSLAFLYVHSRAQTWRPTARRIHHQSRGNRRTITQTNTIGRDLMHCFSEKHLRATRFRAINKKLRRTRWIDHAVARHTQATGESRTQLRFSLDESLLV